MRINKFVAAATGLSRRKADELVANHEITVNGAPVNAGYDVQTTDSVEWGQRTLQLNSEKLTIMLNKPVGYVCSRNGQGSKTVYDLLPSELHNLKPVGRLDKDSSGLLLLTNDGELTQQLTHPSFQKDKVYEVELEAALKASDHTKLQRGITLADGLSKLQLSGKEKQWTVTMHEGRNRQIRRTFAALGYQVTKLHRIQFGHYNLNKLVSGEFSNI